MGSLFEVEFWSRSRENAIDYFASLILSLLSLSYLGILLEGADRAEPLLAQAERLERRTLEAYVVPREAL